MSLKGFTLIELIMVLAILSILGVTVMPRVTNVSDEARNAAVLSVVAAINEASSVNFIGVQLSGAFVLSGPQSATKVTQLSGASSCASLIASSAGLTGGSLPSSMQIASEASCTGLGSGQAVTCNVQDRKRPWISALATVVCTG